MPPEEFLAEAEPEKEVARVLANLISLQGSWDEARQLRDEVELQLARVFWIELRRWMQALGQGAREAAQNAPLAYTKNLFQN